MAYTLRTSVQPLANPGEPDEAPAAARPLAFATAVDGALAPHVDAAGKLTEDHDHYRVEISRGGTVHATVTSGVRNVHVKLEILDERGRRVAKADVGPDDPPGVRLTADVKPGTYTIHVGHRWYNGHVAEVGRNGEIAWPYRLEVTSRDVSR